MSALSSVDPTVVGYRWTESACVVRVKPLGLLLHREIVLHRLPVGKLSDIPTTPSHATRAERPVITWIATRTITIKNRTQAIWTATAATPAKCRTPAITPTTKNIRAQYHITTSF